MTAMAGMDAKIAVLLSLLAVSLLARTLLIHQPRLDATLVIDRLLSSTFDLRLVKLVNRRNMILLCHAILLLILNDAGLLTAPARHRTTANCSEPQPKSRMDAKSSTCAQDKREHRRRSKTTTTRLRRRIPLLPSQDTVVQEIDLLEVEKPSFQCCFNFDHADGNENEIGVASDDISSLHFELVDEDEGSRGKVEEMAPQETEAEDMDEMNKRFEDFIAKMRTKMQLESMQLVKV
ncbi:uncharacterized protein LOC104581762 [Brachypodium distachyon]|nr:uncharacterized protein LOC104581762 [Brachypodium distachyon]|eukprot:XP_010228509.2 uncharacterized protein LOC104581762 [Brachypodium distachyon]